MSTHTIAEAEGRLAELIDRALDGEGVVITRDGTPVVTLTPMPARRRRPHQRRWTVEEQLEWLRDHRARLTPIDTDAGTFVSQMRDEEWNR